MKPDERRELWEELSVIEDWLSGGVRIPRDLPDFAARGMTDLGRTVDALVREPDSSDSLERVAREVLLCRSCRLAAGRTHPAPGEGVARPTVLVIGEGPGAEEDASGRPFVGPAGQLLDRMLAAIGLSRTENCYIANVVKCRPPNNRDPAPDEVAACACFLERQAAILRPRAILCVGRVAAQALTGRIEGVGRLRGKLYAWRGIPVVVTYHPSALLRDPAWKRPAWEDLKTLRAFLDADAAPGGAWTNSDSWGA